MAELVRPFSAALTDDMKAQAADFLGRVAAGATGLPVNTKVAEFIAAASRAHGSP